MSDEITIKLKSKHESAQLPTEKMKRHMLKAGTIEFDESVRTPISIDYRKTNTMKQQKTIEISGITGKRRSDKF